MNPLLRVWARRAIPLLLLGLAAALYLVNRAYVEAAPARNDFIARWEGGRGWVQEGLSPYDPQVSLRAQERVYGRPANLRRGEDPYHFLYPLSALAVFGPLGALDFKVAHALWLSVVGFSLLVSTALWARAIRWKPSPVLVGALGGFAVLWFPGFSALIASQPAALIGLLLAGGLAALEARRDAVAGLLLAASLVKPQLGFGLVAFVAVWGLASRRRALLGWLAVGVVLPFGAALLADPAWPLAMARQVVDYASAPVAPSALARLAAEIGAGATGTLLLSAVLVGYVLWEWRQTLHGDHRRFLWTAALTHTAVLLITPFASLPNLSTLTFGVVAVLEAWSARHGRAIDAVAAIALLLLAGFSWLSSAATLEGGEPSLWMLVGLPGIMILALLWIRWWSIRGRVWSDLGSLGT